MERKAALCLAVLLSVCCAGCVTRQPETEKLQDLEFTVVDEDEIPEEFAEVIEAKKEKPFKLTFTDRTSGEDPVLYIAEGYGAQPESGYSVSVTEVYETENAVCVRTELLGPDKGEDTEETITFPYVVVCIEYSEKSVVFD